MKPLSLLFFLLILLLGGCEQSPAPPATEGEVTTQGEPAPSPPSPPIIEDFEGEPTLSLFPRAGDSQPPLDDERHAYWRTFIDHLTRTSGLVQKEGEAPNRAWSFRSINTIDSVGYFAPLEVEPQTSYTVSFRMQTELPEKASAGVGILQFDQFLWVGEQYDDETLKKHMSGPPTLGKKLTGTTTLDERQTFSFTTTPGTHMIHLVFFREGPHNRNPVLLDDVSVTADPIDVETPQPEEPSQGASRR